MLELVPERDQAARGPETRAEEIGQVLDRAFGARRIAARKARNRVHAVEEEMRPDPRL
jgi:hypothetical protein